MKNKSKDIKKKKPKEMTAEEIEEEKKQREAEQEQRRLSDEARMQGNGKSTPGYISRIRKINIIWLLVWIVIAVAIFTTGWLIWNTRANILTVLAVLLVLPGAKRIVALVAIGRKKSVTPERCHRVETEVEPYIYAGELDIHEFEPEEPDEEPSGEEEGRSPYEEPEIPVYFPTIKKPPARNSELHL